MHSFKNHPLTSDQKRWLEQAAKDGPSFSPRAARVALAGLIASDFAPTAIDPRLYAHKRLTPVGLWHVDPEHYLFDAIDTTIRAVQENIRRQPNLKSVTAADIAAATGLTERVVGEALYAASELGEHFFTQATGYKDHPKAYSQLDLPDEDSANDPYLSFTSVNDLLEQFYVRNGHGMGPTRNDKPPNAAREQGAPPHQPTQRVTLDTNCLINLFDRQSSSATSVPELNELIRWALSGQLRISVTTRVEADMLNDANQERREQMLRTLQAFPVIGTQGRFDTTKWDSADVLSGDRLNQLRNEIKAIVFPGLQPSDGRYSNKINDIDHMVGHVLNRGDIFVTDDMGILRRADQLKQGTGLVIMTPAQCVKHIDHSLIRASISNPASPANQSASSALPHPRSTIELPEAAVEVFELARRVANSGDVFSWNQLRDKGLAVCVQALLNWRSTSRDILPNEASARRSWTLQLLSTHSSAIALAMAGAMSNDRRFVQPASLVDRVINPDGWELSGMTTMVRAPETIGWLVHLLEGAAHVYTDRLDLAISLARSRVRLNNKSHVIVECPELNGWPPTLRDSKESWSFITGLPRNWPWLESVLGGRQSYRVALAAYLIVLHLCEFAGRLRRGERFESENFHDFRLSVPLAFISEDTVIQQRARQYVASHHTSLQLLFPDTSSRAAARNRWPHWLSSCAYVSRSDHHYGEGTKLANYADLLTTALEE